MKHLLEAETDPGLELEPGHDEIGNHGDVDLAQDGVFRGTYKGLETKVLLDEPEEGFDLPAFLVDVGNGLGREIEMVGQELVEFSGFRVSVSDTAESKPLAPDGDADHVVRGHTRAFPDRTSLEHLVDGVGLEPGDKEQAGSAQCPEPGIVDVGFVEYGDGTLGKPEHFDHLGIVQPGLGDTDEGRQVSVMVENNMNFHPTAPGTEIGPWKGGQAELDHRGVEAEELGLEPELVIRGHGRASLVHFSEQGLEELGRALGVGIGKSRAGHDPKAQMIQPPDVGSQAANAIAHASAASQMNEEQTSELIPSRECPGTPAGTVFPGQDLEFIPGNQG